MYKNMSNILQLSYSQQIEPLLLLILYYLHYYYVLQNVLVNNYITVICQDETSSKFRFTIQNNKRLKMLMECYCKFTVSIKYINDYNGFLQSVQLYYIYLLLLSIYKVDNVYIYFILTTNLVDCVFSTLSNFRIQSTQSLGNTYV